MKGVGPKRKSIPRPPKPEPPKPPPPRPKRSVTFEACPPSTKFLNVESRLEKEYQKLQAEIANLSKKLEGKEYAIQVVNEELEREEQ